MIWRLQKWWAVKNQVKVVKLMALYNIYVTEVQQEGTQAHTLTGKQIKIESKKKRKSNEE